MLNDLALFITVVRNNSFSKAASELNISQSKVSRRIQNLQYELRQELIVRTIKGFVLTDAGKSLYEKVVDSINKLDSTLKNYTSPIDSPNGTVRVGVSSGFGSMRITPFIHEFNELYPNIKVKLHFESYSSSDLNYYDIIVTPFYDVEKDSNLAQKIYTSNIVLACSRFYTFRDSLPTTLEEIDNHLTVGLYPINVISDIVNIDNPSEIITYQFRPKVLATMMTKTTFLAYYNNYLALSSEEQVKVFNMIKVLPQYRFGQINYYLFKKPKCSQEAALFADFILECIKKELYPLFE